MSAAPDLEGPAWLAVTSCLATAPTLGAGRLLCVDGPSGSGKTTFARAVRRTVPAKVTVTVVHLDALYPGWDGLAAGVERVGRDLLGPLSRGEPGGYRRYDWVQHRETDWVEVSPVDLLVLEGVGAGGDGSWQHLTTLLVWVEAPRDVRAARAVTRDGIATREQLHAWRVREDAWYDEHRTRDRADLVVTTG